MFYCCVTIDIFNNRYSNASCFSLFLVIPVRLALQYHGPPVSHVQKKTNGIVELRRGAVAWWLRPRTPEREVGGLSPSWVAVLCP